MSILAEKGARNTHVFVKLYFLACSSLLTYVYCTRAILSYILMSRLDSRVQEESLVLAPVPRSRISLLWLMIGHQSSYPIGAQLNDVRRSICIRTEIGMGHPSSNVTLILEDNKIGHRSIR